MQRTCGCGAQSNLHLVCFADRSLYLFQDAPWRLNFNPDMANLSVPSLTAISISCLSAFPQLFSGKARKKPVWTPKDTCYQRLRSRTKLSRRKQNTLYDLSTITVSGDQEAEPQINTDSMDRQGPVLVPKSTWQKPTATCYRGPTDENAIAPQASQITRQFEYQITEQQAPRCVVTPQGRYHQV